MRIGINALAVANLKTGISKYSVRLIENLLRNDPGNEYYIFAGKEFSESYDTPNVHIVRIPYLTRQAERILFEQFVLPFYIKRYKIDLLHCLSYSIPLIKPCPTVVTVHDLAYKMHPETVLRSKLFYYNLLFPSCMKAADKIITDSENTKSDIMKVYKIPGEKIQAVLLGVDAAYKPLTRKECNEKLRLVHLPEKYILYTGSIEPRKNLSALIKAYAAAKKHIDCKLVVAGAKGWMYSDIFETVSKLSLEGDILFTGYLEDELMPYLYSRAEVFILPSLDEGFGLPVLEAMASAVPVITSGNSSLLEVGGDAAVFVNPLDIQDIADKLMQVLNDHELRKELAAKGIRRAKAFDWARTARKTLQVYQETMALKRIAGS